MTTLGCLRNQHQEAQEMSYAGLDLSRKRLDVHVLDEEGTSVEVTAVRPDADALRTLASHVFRHGQEVTAVIESMTKRSAVVTIRVENEGRLAAIAQGTCTVKMAEEKVG